MSHPTEEPNPPAGRVWLMAENPREPELVFDFPFDEQLNEAVKHLPRRWFDWRRKHWRVPAHPRLAKTIEGLLGRFPELQPSPEVLAWISDSDRWRALVSVLGYEGRGAFVMRTLTGEAPGDLEGANVVGEGRAVFPFSARSARRLSEAEGAQLDDLARLCARELIEGREPPPAELRIEIGDDGEPAIAIFTVWDSGPARDFRLLPEAHPVDRAA